MSTDMTESMEIMKLTMSATQLGIGQKMAKI